MIGDKHLYKSGPFQTSDKLTTTTDITQALTDHYQTL